VPVAGDLGSLFGGWIRKHPSIVSQVVEELLGSLFQMTEELSLLLLSLSVLGGVLVYTMMWFYGEFLGSKELLEKGRGKESFGLDFF
jgi:hypothetical protein